MTSRTRSVACSPRSVATSWRPTRNARSGVSGSSLATPRIPSVPNRRVTGSSPPMVPASSAPPADLDGDQHPLLVRQVHGLGQHEPYTLRDGLVLPESMYLTDQ